MVNFGTLHLVYSLYHNAIFSYTENPEESTTEILYTVPQEIILVHLGVAITVMIKAVITIRRERRESKVEDSRKNKKKPKNK